MGQERVSHKKSGKFTAGHRSLPEHHRRAKDDVVTAHDRDRHVAAFTRSSNVEAVREVHREKWRDVHLLGLFKVLHSPASVQYVRM
jgi:hypothetical protein